MEPNDPSRDEIEFQDYRIVNMFRDKSEQEIEAIADLWRRNQVLPRQTSPYERVPQVVYSALDRDERVVAVSTIYRGEVGEHGDPYFYYRMFIDPNARIPWLMRYMTMMTYQLLRDTPMPEKPVGMAIVMENPKLSGPGMNRRWERWGCTYIGKDPRGHDIWLRDF